MASVELSVKGSGNFVSVDMPSVRVLSTDCRKFSTEMQFICEYIHSKVMDGDSILNHEIDAMINLRFALVDRLHKLETAIIHQRDKEFLSGSDNT